MADDTNLPVPQPLATAPESPSTAPQGGSAAPQGGSPASLPAPQPLPAPIPVTPSASSLAPPEAVSEPSASGTLPPPVDVSTQPLPAAQDSALSRWAASLKRDASAAAQMVTGPGTWLGPETAGPTFEQIAHQPISKTFEQEKDAFKKFLDLSAIIPYNGVTEEEAAANPKMAAASRGVSNAIRGLTTPASVGLILATSGLDSLPAALEGTLAKSETLAPYAARAAKVAQKSLGALSLYFTLDQATKVMESVPEVAQAVMSGQTNKAIELATAAFINGAVAGYAGRETYRSLHPEINPAAETSAMKHGDYADMVHERQKTLQIGGGQKKQIADLGQESVPNLKDREWTTDYVEANQDRDLLRKRQAETKAGPKPTELIAAAQGEPAVIEEAPQGGHAGGGVASVEELNREGRFVKVSKSGQLTDQGKSPDFNLKPGEAGYQVKPDGSYELKAGQETPATELGVKNYAKEVFPPKTNKPFNPEGTFYHGTKADVSDISELKPDQYSQATGMFGLGTYLTDNPEVASGYATTRGNGAGRVLGTELPKGEYLNADAAVEPKIRSIFESAAPSDSDPLEGNNIRDLFKSLRERYNDAGWSVDEATEPLQTLTAKLRDAGYVGLRYEGGKTAAGKKYGPHNVAVIFPDYEGKPTELKPATPAKPAVAKETPIKYTTDANGTVWAETSDSPARVSIPKGLEGSEAEKYAREKLDLQKQFAASRATTPARTEEIAPIVATGEATPASQEMIDLQAALRDAAEQAKAHVITPEERAAMVEQQDPDRQISSKHQKAIDYVTGVMDRIKEEAQKRGLLPQGHLRENFVPHEYDFDDTSDPTRRRLYDTYHDAQQAGLVGKNKDYFALASDYIAKMRNKIADADTVRALKLGRTNEGIPLAVPGGFVEGQHVSTEKPQSYVLSDAETNILKRRNQFNNLVRKGRIVQNPDGSFTMKADDFVKAKNLYETRPIGQTPIPANMLKQMQESGLLAELEAKKLIYKNAKGEYLSKEPLYARVPVYLHPDIAEHFNEVVKPQSEEPTSFFGRAGKLYDDVTGNMKSLLLSWSPFHRVTESMRMMESLGLTKGAKLAAQTNLGLAPKIDYVNLEPWQEAAIRDGIVTSDPRGRSMSNVEEGLSAGEGNTWGAKSYRLLDKGLEKLGVPPAIRNKINLQKILTEDVFGPQGMITQAKFEFYKNRKPEIAAQIAKDHPDWSEWEVDKHAGRLTAQFANNKFGGLNNVLLGRTLHDQKLLRRILLAPDFLESTGRSILDLAHPYGNELATKLIEFNIAHALTAAGINYALHRDPDDHSIKGAVEASHILDHPYSVVGPDNKTVYGLRTTVTDFEHLLNKPRQFVYNRVSPLLRSADEIVEQRNQYGRKESLTEALKSLPKATLPIQAQNAVGLGPNTTTEPSAADQFMKSIGIQARPNRSNAEQLAIDKVSAKLQGQEARTGQALVRQQLKFNAEDKLRAAYQMQDPEKKRAAIDDAKHDIANLAHRKIINPEEQKKILVDARGSRLKSIFNSLTPTDALDVWDKATDEEKKELGVAMNSKYLRWRENLVKNGLSVNNLNADDQEVLNRFRTASGQLAEIRERPEPLPTKKASAQEKAAAPAAQLPAPVPMVGELPRPEALEAPGAPAVFKAGDFTPIVDKAAAKYGVDPTLVAAVIHRESAGNPQATSNKNAHGLMQLLPATAKQYGVTDINDPEQNIDAGTHYLADLLKRYGGDEKLALAAYNAGPDAVDKYKGVPPYRETKDYVDTIQNRVR